ncbi:bifunctional histidinol-phosphatase/imidazoleglycerol-phosphate dehydratase HisB [Schleiferia thermophila]|jgi:imidazoleglycerol-phosphate dehydratase/histidinol-phosphatase|uniref:bifunctional histidinol-phosphatase/imidazoleglycerol-phosphate dehydratase HisB n=1 Tax=Schleiferia thermophila TaxID=884107 RepID=UPI0004E7BD17|nr:bifunctional histidinol-phosphatase/imidazoleglycerol-phosphate dehydratase HisB [Schleiferia thermophila]KFD39527.1 imidazoleglycerol-phosphate dehydratase [Schleiferia thermophila str. Yellowstone]
MKEKILFIDRDGTLVKEPPVTFQIDHFEQVEFLPGMLTSLSRIAKSERYRLVMVTNQDGLGTDTYPEERFQPIQQLILRTMESVGIHFSEVHIDRSRPEENLPTRKPGIAMLTRYITGEYDLENSFVIGDRLTDAQLAANLGCKAILINNSEAAESSHLPIALTAGHWQEIEEFLISPPRKSAIRRKTAETDITVEINLDGSGQAHQISTGIGFLDHMLEQMSKHSGIDLSVAAKGDLHIDEHHTAEDTALALGMAFKAALSDKSGLERYGFVLPMDDCRALVAIDFGGRPWLVWKAKFRREKIGDFPTEMLYHFFKSFSDAAACNLLIRAKGKNEHHKAESIFKAFGRALKMAIRREKGNFQLPTTKGVL